MNAWVGGWTDRWVDGEMDGWVAIRMVDKKQSEEGGERGGEWAQHTATLSKHTQRAQQRRGQHSAGVASTGPETSAGLYLAQPFPLRGTLCTRHKDSGSQAPCQQGTGKK